MQIKMHNFFSTENEEFNHTTQNEYKKEVYERKNQYKQEVVLIKTSKEVKICAYLT